MSPAEARTHPLWRRFALPADEEIARARVGGRATRPIAAVDPDLAWPEAFARVRDRVLLALGPAALSVTHIGSTSVPGLAAA